jgi:hypothetical protein
MAALNNKARDFSAPLLLVMFDAAISHRRL